MDAGVAASAPKQEIRLEDYRAPAFEIEGVNLTFRLFDAIAEVEATSRFRMLKGAGTSLYLDGGPYMELLAVEVDGKAPAEADITKSADGLELRNLPAAFSLRIVTKLFPKENTRLEGLYFSGGNFCTQCEAEGFRHITYFPDRPDVLTRYHVRIEADKTACPVLLSNGNPGVAGDLGAERHFAEWEDPYLKPCYLFALVAGNLGCLSDSFTTRSGREVALNIYAAEQDLDKCDYAMQSLKRSMVWDEDVFGLEYDLDIYNIVAVSDFNMGAMENKGLNVFNTKYVLASEDTATDADFDHVEGVIGHEYFHNWTGNRVTCRDWFQLSLKEGLTVFRDQEFSSDMTSRAVKRLDDVRVLRMLQFPEDAGPLAHPVRPEKYIEINNFYTTTVYNKGAEVIRMMHRLIGADAFRAGMDLYFKRHDGQAATCEDFVAAMEAASGVDLAQFRLWYSQAGTPRLKIKRAREGADVLLTIEQSCPQTPGQQIKLPFHMPVLVGWVGGNGGDVQPAVEGGAWQEGGCLLELRQPRETFRFRDVPEHTVPSLLRGFTAPVILEHDLGSEELAFLMSHDTDAFARWEAAQDLYSDAMLKQVGEGASPVAVPDVISAAFQHLLEDNSTDPALLAELLALPSEISVGQRMATLASDDIHRVREGFASELATCNREMLRQRYLELEEAARGSGQKAKASRRLRNILLGYVALTPDGEALVQEHYRSARNMTDRMAGLTLVAHSDYPSREATLEEFYETWQHNDLVVDKWFAVQAQSKRQDTARHVQSLTAHPAFTLKNPNRLRSLVSTFSMLNQVRFHEADGSGYEFLAKMIVEVDKINPQTAARLVPPLGRWERLGGHRKQLMREALKSVLASDGLSDDVRELVEKSLS